MSSDHSLGRAPYVDALVQESFLRSHDLSSDDTIEYLSSDDTIVRLSTDWLSPDRRNPGVDQTQSSSTHVTGFSIHPWLSLAQKRQRLKEWQTAYASYCFLGEVGLDRITTDESKWAAELEFFSELVKCAQKFKKPLLLHIVRAYDEVFKILDGAGYSQPFIVHGFNRSATLAQKVKERGGYLSFNVSGIPKFSTVIQHIGLEHILLETDQPRLCRESFSRMEGELILPQERFEYDPTAIVRAYNNLAGVLEVPVDVVRKQLYKNSEHFCAIKPQIQK